MVRYAEKWERESRGECIGTVRLRARWDGGLISGLRPPLYNSYDFSSSVVGHDEIEVSVVPCTRGVRVSVHVDSCLTEAFSGCLSFMQRRACVSMNLFAAVADGHVAFA